MPVAERLFYGAVGDAAGWSSGTPSFHQALSAELAISIDSGECN